MDWSDFIYFPVLKTKDAELRAISSISKSIRDKIIPIYELTKSRITKRDPVGDVSKRLEQINSIQCGMPFILDVTTEEKQTNRQIESCLVADDGYLYWRKLLEASCGVNVIPAIHINQESDADLVHAKKFVREVSHLYSRLALRLPTGLLVEEYEEILHALVPELGASKLYILLDDGCIRSTVKETSISSVAEGYATAFVYLDSMAGSEFWLESIVCISGSFPALVAREGGGDTKGSFDIYEHGLYKELSPKYPKFRFGDYAAININQIEMRGGTFIPRIDFCTDEKFYYYRYRRESGSYISCAKDVVADVNFSNSLSWGDDEIRSAAFGSPSGISPSFWISVRSSNYMIRRVSVLAV